MHSHKDIKEIPIFFATDNNYAPYLCVSVASMLANASTDYFYRIYVLTTDLDPCIERKIRNCITDNASIEFMSLANELDKIQSMFHLRDYYSKETYYRIFIPNLFPQYDKVLYLDCDIVVLGDISELYNTDIGGSYVGAVQEEVMSEVKVFGDYVEKALDIPCGDYFSAGILLMNTKLLRENSFEEKFVDLLNRFKFTVTQDQDYLNVLCRGKVRYIDLGWNKTAFRNPEFDDGDLRIVHYKIHWKPWHYDGVLYEEFFWKYAVETEFYDMLLEQRKSYSDAQKENDRIAYDRLMAQAAADSADPGNYRNTLRRGATA